MGKLITKVVDEEGRELSLGEQYAAAAEAWAEVLAAIDRAWRITPIEACRLRIRVPRKASNQNIAQSAAQALHVATQKAAARIESNGRAREAGLRWALATDEEAAQMALESVNGTAP